MPIYKVLHNHILHDGMLYEPGEAIELKENQAEGLRVSLSEDADTGARSPRKGKK
jgi:hypothetical protein